MSGEPNERTRGRTSGRVQYSGEYKTVCCARVSRFAVGEQFGVCPDHGQAEWSWIPPLPQGIAPASIPSAEAVGQATISINEPLLPLASANPLLQAVLEFGDRTNEGVLIRAVAVPWFEIARRIKNDPKFLEQFAENPRRFEEFLAACYEQTGQYQVVLTPYSGDLGRDVIISATLPGAGTIRFVDQAKAYRPGHAVPAKDVRELAGVLLREPQTHKGIVTTTSTFAPGVAQEYQRLIAQNRLLLKDREALVQWLGDLTG